MRCAWQPRVPKCKSDRNRVLYLWVCWDLGTGGLLARGRTTRNDCADSHVASMTRRTGRFTIRRTQGLIILSLKSVESRGATVDLGIAGRKAIVCASSKGLGRACARALAEAGCAVVLNGRDQEGLDRTARDLRDAPAVQTL